MSSGWDKEVKEGGSQGRELAPIKPTAGCVLPRKRELRGAEGGTVPPRKAGRRRPGSTELKLNKGS